MTYTNNIESAIGCTNVQKKRQFDANIVSEKYNILLFHAYKGVRDGYDKAEQYVFENPYEFFNKRHEASTKNAKVLSEFFLRLLTDFKSKDMVLKMGTYGMTYFLIDNKALLCFKMLNKKGKITNALTERHKNSMAGNDVKLKKSVIAELRKRGIEEQPPIYYLGYQPTDKGLVIKLLRFENNEPAFDLNFSDLFINRIDKLNIRIKDRPNPNNKLKLVK